MCRSSGAPPLPTELRGKWIGREPGENTEKEQNDELGVEGKEAVLSLPSVG